MSTNGGDEMRINKVIMEEIQRNNNMITTSQIVDLGFSRALLSNYVKAGLLERGRQGVYILPDSVHDDMYTLMLRTEKIIFSHDTALFLNGLSERTPFEHTVTIPSNSVLSNVLMEECNCYYVKPELYELGIVKGYTENEFGPEKNISRIEFMTMLSRTLKQMGNYAVEGGLVYYHMDYDQTHWSKNEYDYLMRCYQAVEPSDLASMGYYTLAEVFGSSIEMNKAITREEVVALMDCFLKYESAEVDFTDIENSNFKESILKAYESGLINGYPDGTFRPNNPITRAEMAVILSRYIGEYEFVI